MGVDTKIYLNSRDPQEVATFLSKHTMVKEASFTEAENDSYKYREVFRSELQGHIDATLFVKCPHFVSGFEERSLFVVIDEDDGLMYLAIGAWGSNEVLARELVYEFGGYADYNDCDNSKIDFAQPGRRVRGGV